MAKTLTGKTALVTGSTRGIGLGIARVLAGEGADIVLHGLMGADEARELERAFADDFGVKVTFDDTDLSDGSACRAMMERLEGSVGGVDILVNNAGIQHTDKVEDFPQAKWDAVIAVNLSAVFHCTAAVVPGMKARGWGRVVNIASAHGLVASPEKAAYVAAKHGVVGLTKVVALETANSGVTVNAICPGWVRTPLVEQQIQSRADKSGRTVEQEAGALLSEKQPMEQFTEPEQLGALAAFLCTDAAATVTGVSWPMDGGWTAR